MKALDNYKTGLDTLYLFSEACGKLVHAMGKPVFVNDGKRAYVMLDDNKQIVFCLDKEYFSNLEYDEDMAFVLLHEALHVAWNHLKELGMDQYSNKKVLTVAQEVVINDSIPKISGILQPDMEGPAGDYMTGPEMFNHDFSGMTTRQAYDYIIKNMPEDMDLSDTDVCEIAISVGGEGDGDGDDSDSGMDPGEIDDLMQAVMQAIKGEFGDDEDELSEVAAPGTMNSSDMFKEGSDGSSTGGSTGTRESSYVSGMEFNFAELLARINPKVLSGSGKNGNDLYKIDWTAPRHSMRTYYPDMIIPRVAEIGADGDSIDEVSPDVLFATDQSGSIDSKYVGISQELLDSMPDNLFTPHMSIWADHCAEYVKGKSKPNVGYGTSIRSVYKYASNLRSSKGIDPYVVVFTDGGYTWGDVDEDWVRNRWFFVAFRSGDINPIKNGYGRTCPVNPDNVYLLSDLWKS